MMKRILATAILTLPIMVASLPKPASALEVILGPSHRDRYERVAQRREWIRGHWEHTRYGRHWVPGHYAYVRY